MLRRVAKAFQSRILRRSAASLRYFLLRQGFGGQAFFISHPQSAHLKRFCVLMGGAILLSGCYASSADLSTPAVQDSWMGDEAFDAKRTENLQGWWELFDDAVLNDLVEMALVSSPQRNIAEARILEARGVKRTSRSYLLPQIGASGTAGQQKTTDADSDDYYDAGFDAAWEIDVFGKRRAQLSAGDAQLQGVEALYDDVSLTLIAEIARVYIDYRVAQNQVRIAESNLALQVRTLEIAVALAVVGEGPRLDVERAETIVNATRALLPAFGRQVDAARLQLSVLVGEMPADLAGILAAEGDVPAASVLPVLQAPADIVALRPDVRAAGFALAQASDLADAAVRDLFPTISLSGFFGVADSALSSAKTVWNVAANAAVALIDFGRLEGAIDSARAQEWQTFEAYRQVVIGAVVEVETALSDYAHLRAQRLALSASFDAAERAFSMSLALYREGEIGFLDVLDAQRSLNGVEADLVSALGMQSESLVRLYKSLGVY